MTDDNGGPMSETSGEVALSVHQDKCIGAGQCEMLEEETFLIDDDTVIAGVIGTGTLPVDRAQIVVERCPSQAIYIVQGEEE